MGIPLIVIGDKTSHGGTVISCSPMIRRPDVVIVNDPAKPPTQDNIKQVVEIKFPPDKRDLRQNAA